MGHCGVFFILILPLLSSPAVKIDWWDEQPAIVSDSGWGTKSRHPGGAEEGWRQLDPAPPTPALHEDPLHICICCLHPYDTWQLQGWLPRAGPDAEVSRWWSSCKGHRELDLGPGKIFLGNLSQEWDYLVHSPGFGGSGQYEHVCKKLRLKVDFGRQKGGCLWAELATHLCLKIGNK